jgi:dipeptidyl aminopeptidase/acylaminoacyl peptidase
MTLSPVEIARRRQWPISAVVAAFMLLCAGLSTAAAQTGTTLETGYQKPPKVVMDIMDAPPPPIAIVSPTGQTMALLERTSLPPIADLAQPMLRLAGVRVNPGTNGPHGAQTTYGITLKTVPGGLDKKVPLPPGSKISSAAFSPDGKWLSFFMTRPKGVELWLVDTATAQAKAVSTATINGLSGCDWLDDSTALLCGFVPDGRGPAPLPPAVPTGPRIQENMGKVAPVSTYQDLLTSAYDESLFEYYFTAQMALVSTTGVKTPVGAPAVFESASMSPNGQFVLVAKTAKPYSRLVPYYGFPKTVEVWTRAGKRAYAFAPVPSSESTPIGGVITGPRSYRWVTTDPATLMWTEALDNGDPRQQAPYRDKTVTLAAPFAGSPAEYLKTQWRFGGVAWTEKGVAFATESDRATRMSRTWIIDRPGAAPRKWQERRQADRYSDPGSPMTRGGSAAGAFGRFSGNGEIMQVGNTIFLTGAGASPQGDRPFVDRLNLETLTAERLFQCDGGSYETVTAVLSDDGKKLLTRWETKTDYPNYYVRDLAAGTKTALTAFKDPAPQLTGVQKQLVTYARKDGVTLSATVYLPPDYTPGTKLPFVLWAYPAEFTDASTASQVSGSPNRFTTISGASYLLFLTQGYGVMDNPTMPIVGPGETANDTYVEQLVASAEAAVDKIVEMGVADRDRIGISGHSYGAFMTANLLAHSDIFRAGVARSGAYNRTLTPFGFQNEQRTFWEVPQIYSRMSPFNYANKVNEPILLIHGEADNNSGTFPIQSERFYMALKGHGATVRYVTLPLEAHGYSARESNLHVMREWIDWFDKYVKNAKAR